MTEYEATFQIDSESDAYAVARLMAAVYDSLREESRTLREGSSDSSEMIVQFRELREAARQPKPGRLTVTFEQRDEAFED
ncbi:MAG: hypothetical protein ABEJ57_05425 [Halobacteriaceae archaeon]